MGQICKEISILPKVSVSEVKMLLNISLKGNISRNSTMIMQIIETIAKDIAKNLFLKRIRMLISIKNNNLWNR